MKVLYTHKPLDLEKERSEKKLSLQDFLLSYNDSIPSEFPEATDAFLLEFRKKYPGLFKGRDVWTLGDHRKKVMDWLPQRVKQSDNAT